MGRHGRRDQPGLHPTVQQSPPHMPRPDEPNRQGAGHQARPTVSNMADCMASTADLPAHTTNWNAG